ncbi:hypothetical protein [Streptomyces thinghirensis]|uniref:Uncharacterized protein n=1 Tax=Streptomyces thinghirensis TaxID=551547 RepID=A0ABP9SZ71_9ACTN
MTVQVTPVGLGGGEAGEREALCDAITVVRTEAVHAQKTGATPAPEEPRACEAARLLLHLCRLRRPIEHLVQFGYGNTELPGVLLAGLTGLAQLPFRGCDMCESVPGTGELVGRHVDLHGESGERLDPGAVQPGHMVGADERPVPRDVR